MWIVLVMVMAMAGASGINMSIRLGRNEPYGARQAGYIGIVLCSVVSSLIGLFVWIKVEWFGRIFTNDETFLAVLDGFRRASRVSSVRGASVKSCRVAVVCSLSQRVRAKIHATVQRTDGDKLPSAPSRVVSTTHCRATVPSSRNRNPHHRD